MSVDDRRFVPTASRRWTIGFVVLSGLWLLAGWWIVPAIIESAYRDGVFGFLGGLMEGRGDLPVGRYVESWTWLASRVLAGLATTWLVGLILLQPITWRIARNAYRGLPTFGGRVRRRTVALSLALAAITIGIQSTHLSRWETAQGHEYESIALGLGEGEGFSFPPGKRWLVLDDEPDAGEHGVTAWKEPVYPYFMAAAFRLFGPRWGRLVVVLVQVGFLLGTCLLLAALGSRLFSPGIGFAAAILTCLTIDLHWIVTASMQTPAVSGLLLLAGLMLILRYADHPSTRRLVLLGVFLGVAALTHVVLVVLVPIAAIVAVLGVHGRTWREGVRPAVLLALVAALTISPWTIRNYVRFGYVIPVQTGFGLFANVSNPFLAETYLPDLDACRDGSPPVFETTGPLEALLTLRLGDNYTRTWERGVDCVAREHSDTYAALNEHERDGLHKAWFTRFVTRHPWEFLRLTASKAVAYLFDIPVHGRGSIPLAALGIAGMLLVVRRPRMWIFPLAVLAYSAPFVLTAPIYYRYRAPLTPLLMLFAVLLLSRLLGGPTARLVGAAKSRILPAVTGVDHSAPVPEQSEYGGGEG